MDWDDYNEKYAPKVKEMLRSGIPNKLRKHIWSRLLKIPDLAHKNPALFEVSLLRSR